MLKLTSLQSEPFWLEILPPQKSGSGKAAQDIPAQRTQFRPVAMSMILVARQQAAKALLEGLGGKTGDALAPVDAALADAKGRVAFVVAMAQLGIVAWEGVGGPDGEEIAPVPESIAAYMSDWRVYDAVDRLYVQPALARIDEKNASAPSRNGTSGAKIRAKDSAKTARKRSAAKSAPTP